MGWCIIISKKKGKDRESIQSSTTPDSGYQWESKLTIRHHKREPRGQPFPFSPEILKAYTYTALEVVVQHVRFQKVLSEGVQLNSDYVFLVDVRREDPNATKIEPSLAADDGPTTLFDVLVAK